MASGLANARDGDFLSDALILDKMNTVVQPSPLSNPAISTRGWTLKGLLAMSKNFRPVPRVSARARDLLMRIEDYEGGERPLVVERCHRHEKWAKDLFTVEWLSANGCQSELFECLTGA